MDIKPVSQAIRVVLGSRRQLSIPRFQREYSWDKKNYQEFLDDMLNNIVFEENKLTPQSYFLGTMLFIGDYNDGSKEVVHVVDGQQRLTTITILFSAMSAIFSEIGDVKASEGIFEYIITKDDDGESGVKVIESQSHYPYFSYYIQDKTKENIQDPTTDEELNIKETYEYFYDRLKETKLRKSMEYTLKSNKIEYIDILKALRDQVLKSLFISISTKDRTQANKIFEILNGKGKKLSDIDLIKNEIFKILDSITPADFATETWKNIKANLNSRDESIGMDTFYRHFWISNYKKTSRDKLHTEFKNYFKPANKEKYKPFMKEMLEYSSLYMKIIKPQRSDYKNKKEFYSLVQSLSAMSDTFNIVQTRVVLMALLKAKNDDKINLTTLKNTILFLEKFHFAYNGLLKSRTNILEKIYSNFSIKLKKTEKANVVQLIKTDLIDKLTPYIPSFEDFQQEFVKLTYTKKYSRNNIITKYILNNIHAYFEETDIYSETSSVEHITAEAKESAAISIGNLILLEMAINKDVEDMDYSEKVKEYKKSKYIWLGKFIEKYKEWDSSKYQERAEKLADLYYYKILKF